MTTPSTHPTAEAEQPSVSQSSVSQSTGSQSTGSQPTLIRASDLTLTVGHTRIWHDLTFSFGEGLSVVRGVSGSGRSSLLLALTGRMSGLTGQLTVAGLDAIGQARRLRAITSVARIAAMIDLESRLSVVESVTERALIDGVPTDRAVVGMRELEGVVDHYFPRDRLIADLDAFDQTMLATCLACVRPARLIVLDDADRGLAVTDQRRLLEALRALTGTGVAIVVSTREPTVIPPDSPQLHLSDPHRSETEPVTPEPAPAGEPAAVPPSEPEST